MSRARHIVVSRDYRPAPDACACALELLLKKSVREEGDPPLAALGNDGTRIKGDSADESSIPKSH
jgi:hypothetical protein